MLIISTGISIRKELFFQKTIRRLLGFVGSNRQNPQHELTFKKHETRASPGFCRRNRKGSEKRQFHP